MGKMHRNMHMHKYALKHKTLPTLNTWMDLKHTHTHKVKAAACRKHSNYECLIYEEYTCNLLTHHCNNTKETLEALNQAHICINRPQNADSVTCLNSPYPNPDPVPLPPGEKTQVSQLLVHTVPKLVGILYWPIVGSSKGSSAFT